MLSRIARKFYYALWKRIYSNEVVVVYEMRNKVIIDKSSITVKEVDEHNVTEAESFQNKRQIRMFQKFLKNGDKGFYAFLDGKCVHRTWVVIAPNLIRFHPMYSEPLNPNEIFIHFSETASWARGKNIFTVVLSYVAEQFSGNRILISTDEANHSSARSIKKSGFVEIQKIYIKVLLGVRTIKSEIINNG